MSDGVDELRAFEAELRRMVERHENPPWWDLMGQWLNWVRRLEHAYVNEDMFAVRWLQWGVGVRAVLVVMWLVGSFWFIAHDEPWPLAVGQIVVGGILGSWIPAAMYKAQAYDLAYWRGRREGAEEVMRGLS